MRYYVGIDLGTSACKGILVDKDGAIVREASAKYDVIYPKNGWSEQNPDDWASAAEKILAELSKGVENDIYGLSVGGQMHGLVALDGDGKVIRPCILWNDGRTEKQTAYLNDVVGREKLTELVGNIAFAGFTAPKLLWMQENEPENFARIAKIMLPKDYLSYKLTGVFSTDYSDASGTLLLDVKNKRWSDEMCRICSVDPSWLPPLYESYEVTGKVKEKYNLPNCVVTAGAGDNAAAAIGTATVDAGDCNISLGTSGTVFIPQDAFSVDGKNALHSFAHANGKWHLMGCILTAASARKWWIEDILGGNDYDLSDAEADASEADPNLIFLPYLSGERSPHNDVNIRGAFVGISANTTKAQMSRAVMEGVAFALRDCVEIARENGISPSKTNLCGGGAKSAVWSQVIADVLGIPVNTLKTEQGPSMGGAILAMVGAGEYENVSKAAKKFVKIGRTFVPNEAKKAEYDKRYEVFRRLYPAIKSATQF